MPKTYCYREAGPRSFYIERCVTVIPKEATERHVVYVMGR